MDTITTKRSFLDILLRSSQTVFSTKDIAILWQETDAKTITNRLRKYVSVGKLVRVHRGFYAKDTQYNRYELATRIYTPAYVSFESVLAQAGVIFQHYTTIYVASYISRTLTVENTVITLVRMKPSFLSNTAGITHTDGYAVASTERAFLDRLYYSPRYHFDNLDPIDWGLVDRLLPLYQNQRLEKTVPLLKNSNTL